MQDGEIFRLCLGEGHFFPCTSKKIQGKVFNVIMPGIQTGGIDFNAIFPVEILSYKTGSI